jgi:hypothetical protein
MVEEQISSLIKEKTQRLQEENARMAQVAQLLRLPGIGPVSSWTFVMEFFGWRRFRNRRCPGHRNRLGLVAVSTPKQVKPVVPGTACWRWEPQVRNQESQEEAWRRYLSDHPERVGVSVKIFHYPNPRPHKA